MKNRKRNHLQNRPPSPPAPTLRRIIQQEVTAFRGPLPPPDILEGFERIVPGSARTIIENFDQQSKHRREIESKVIDVKNTAALRGQWIGGGLALVIAGMGFYLALVGKSSEAITAIVAPIAGVVAIFIYGRTVEYIERKATKGSPPPPE